MAISLFIRNENGIRIHRPEDFFASLMPISESSHGRLSHDTLAISLIVKTNTLGLILIPSYTKLSLLISVSIGNRKLTDYVLN